MRMWGQGRSGKAGTTSLVLTLALLAVLLDNASGAQLLWRTETVATDGGFGPSLAIDSAGRSHIAYSTGGGALKYASQGAAAWTISTIPTTGGEPSLVIDAQDRPRISYVAVPNEDLAYGEWNGVSWTFETVEATGNIGWDSELRLDSAGFPHIVYRRVSGSELLKYAFKDAAGWHVETIATDALGWNGLAIGPGDVPHVAYEVPTGGWGGLKYGTRGPTGWSWQVVETNQGGTDLSLAVDSTGQPHIAYRGAGETLKYATMSGGPWQYTVIDNDRPTGWYTSIAVDSQDRPHIAYEQVINRGFPADPTRGHIKYASQLPSGQWFTEFVDPLGFLIEPSIAVDDAGQPRVAYGLSSSQPTICNAIVCLAGHLKYAEPPAATLTRLP